MRLLIGFSAFLLLGCDLIAGYDDLMPTSASSAGGDAATSGGLGGGGDASGGSAGGDGGMSGGNGGTGGIDPTCTDGVLSGNESDVDCGGSCAPCNNGDLCNAETDCISGDCVSGTCSRWLATFTFDNTTNLHLVDAAIDSQGAIVSVGSLTGSANIGSTTYDAATTDGIIIKLDPYGDVAWVKLVGGAGSDDKMRAVAIDSADNILVGGRCQQDCDFGNGAITSQTTNNAVVAKLSPSGTAVWARAFESSGLEEVESLAVDSADDVYISGIFYQSITIGGTTYNEGVMSGSDIFVAKLDGAMDGTVLASTAFQGSSADEFTSIAVQGNRVVLVGQTRSMIDFGSGTAAGTTDEDVAGFVVSLTAAALQHEWSQVSFSELGAVDDTAAWDVAMDASGNAYVLYVARFAGLDIGGGPIVDDPLIGSRRMVVGRYTSSGTVEWAKVLGNPAPGEVRPSSLSLDPTSGAVLVAGSLWLDTMSVDGQTVAPIVGGADRDHLLAVLDDASGTVAKLEAFGGTHSPSGEYAQPIVAIQPTTGNVVMVGSFENPGVLSFGPSLTATGVVDARNGFVASLGNVTP